MSDKPADQGLSSQRILAELAALARSMGVQVNMECGDFDTSLCRINGETVVYINTNASINRAADVVAEALSDRDLDAHFLLPEVRHLLEHSSSDAASYF